MGVACPARGCQGRLVQEYSDKRLYDQLKFFETLFDVDRAQTKVRRIRLDRPVARPRVLMTRLYIDSTYGNCVLVGGREVGGSLPFFLGS